MVPALPPAVLALTRSGFPSRIQDSSGLSPGTLMLKAPEGHEAHHGLDDLTVRR
jgi:hypothetical protein